MRGQDLTTRAPGDRFYAEAIRELAAKKINPTKTLIEGAPRGCGTRLRTAAWVHTELTDSFGSRFYDQHPSGGVATATEPSSPDELRRAGVRAHLRRCSREVLPRRDGANIPCPACRSSSTKPFLISSSSAPGGCPEAAGDRPARPRAQPNSHPVPAGGASDAGRGYMRRSDGKRLALASSVWPTRPTT